MELEGVRHRAGLVAGLAANVDVGRLTRRTHLQELEFVGMVGRTAVDEVDPREVVEVPILAGDNEAGGNGCGQLTRDIGSSRGRTAPGRVGRDRVSA